jgi:histidine ammonia-lyase
VTTLVLGSVPLTIAESVRFGRDPRLVEFGEGVEERLHQSRAIVDRKLVEGGSVYGLTTSLGSKVSVSLSASDAEWTEELILLNRMVAIGDSLPREVCRTAMLLRLHGLAHGTAGVSPAVVHTLRDLINAGVVVQIPAFGSIGASDLGPGAVLGGAVVGFGDAWYAGRPMSMREAMNQAGIATCDLARKDAIGLFNASAVTLARAAHLIDQLRATTMGGFVAAVANADAFGVNPQVFRDDVNQLKPSPFARESAGLVRSLLHGSWVLGDGAVDSPQQAISFRALVPAIATIVGAIDRVAMAIETEMNGVSDNPVVLLSAGEMSSTAHFHTIEAALQVDAAAIAIAQWANATAQRIQRMINHRSDALPQLLSVRGGAATGLNPLQKTVATLHAAIRSRALPVSTDALAVSDQVEDVASHLPLAVEKMGEQIQYLQSLIAIEAFVATHAFRLRASSSPSRATSLLSAKIFDEIGHFNEDRALGPIVESVAQVLRECRDDIAECVGQGWPNCPLID